MNERFNLMHLPNIFSHCTYQGDSLYQWLRKSISAKVINNAFD